ncbi:MAG: Hsp20/alpha crystallin family protein [Deferribacterota bacterium]|nr:Hsp20/alpha crystallin family protein [Deferribacterota bacterium]
MRRRRDAERGLTPFSGLFDIQDEMNRLFDDFFGTSELPSGIDFVPSLDISETKNDIKVRADLPGLTEKDIEVNISGDILTIKGSKEEEKEEKDENYYRKERAYGNFVRQIQIPKKIKADQVKAKFKNGVLTITMPKAEEAVEKGVKIEVE